MQTLNEDFETWWKMAKYRKRDIEARDKYGELEVIERIADSRCRDWPGTETDVKYFVRLENQVYVGFREPRTETGRRAKYCEFPVFVKENT